MKDDILNITNAYLEIYPEEASREEALVNFLKHNNDQNIIDWNNFDGHLVATSFIYAQKEMKFLVLYHKDLQRYLCPGGHIDNTDTSIWEAAKREAIEETGITDLNVISICDTKIIPFDIDSHIIPYNKRLDLPAHIHFDFRFFFCIAKITNVVLDESESADYLWLDIEDFFAMFDNSLVINKLRKMINK